MKKPKIGVISYRHIEEDRPFKTYTGFVSKVTDKISSFGANVYGIIFPEGKFDPELMEGFDGFVFQGGMLIELCQIEALNYAYENKIPTLGICNGMQAMFGFDVLKSKYKTFDSNKDISMRDEEGDFFLEKVANHNPEDPFFLRNKDKAMHNITIEKGTLLHELMGTDNEMVTSIHNCRCNRKFALNLFELSAYSDDGTIEAIELKDKSQFMLGTQFHIELDNQHDKIIEYFMNEIKKHQN